jgi:hypothetical protein
MENDQMDKYNCFDSSLNANVSILWFCNKGEERERRYADGRCSMSHLSDERWEVNDVMTHG